MPEKHNRYAKSSSQAHQEIQASREVVAKQKAAKEKKRLALQAKGKAEYKRKHPLEFELMQVRAAAKKKKREEGTGN